MTKTNSAPLYVTGMNNYLSVLTIVTLVDDGVQQDIAIKKAINQYQSDREIVIRSWSALKRHYNW